MINTFDNWKITVIMDCDTTLAVKAQGVADVPLSTVDLPYSSSGTPHVYVDSWLKLFTTVDDIGCPVDSCLLMNTDCTITSPVNTNFYMLPVGNIDSPWALSAK